MPSKHKRPIEDASATMPPVPAQSWPAGGLPRVVITDGAAEFHADFPHHPCISERSNAAKPHQPRIGDLIFMRDSLTGYIITMGLAGPTVDVVHGRGDFNVDRPEASDDCQ